MDHRYRLSLLPRTNEIVPQLELPDSDDVPEYIVVLLNFRRLAGKTQQNVQIVSLKASVVLELATRAWELWPVQGAANARLERHLDSIATQVDGTVEPAPRKQHPGVLKAGMCDFVELG